MDTEQQVAKHYSHGALEQAILDGLAASGKDIDKLVSSDLAAVDEFHLGWRAATAELAKGLGLTAASHVLDVGSGIGGPARYFAETYNCRVTGIDLTSEFVDVANALTRRCRLSDRVLFVQGSALAMPFADASFDAATLIHVGMNIEDKARLFAEVKRVLKPKGRFIVYDIMQIAEGELPYPMPWAATAATSFRTPEQYRQLLAGAGFQITGEISRRDLARKLAQEMREKAEAEGLPPLGLHTLMGLEARKERMANVLGTLERGVIAPTEIAATAV